MRLNRPRIPTLMTALLASGFVFASSNMIVFSTMGTSCPLNFTVVPSTETSSMYSSVRSQ